MAEMNANVPLPDAPNGNPTGKIAHAGDSLNVSESRDGWSRVEIVNVGRDKGWVQSTFIDNAAAAAAVAPIDPQKFANACVIQALINGVNPHYLVGVAKLRSGISGGDADNRIGPFRLTAEEWRTIVPPFTTDDITSNNQQIAGSAFMVQRQLKTLGDSATPVAQWPDAPADIAAQLKTAFDDTAAIEAKAEQDVLDPPADPGADPPASGGQFGGEISSLPMSQRAYNLIVAFEVSGEAVYNKRYRHPEWPGGNSGVTIGIGYDVGYCSAAQLSNDWKNEIPDPMIGLLQTVRGLTGQAAANALASVTAVDVPWEAAINVNRKTVIPRWVDIVTKALPHAGQLSPDSLGALVSLAYNRGPSFSASGGRYLEMREIKEAMTAGNFSTIPGLIRDMKWLWPDVSGLLTRRDREAQLFQDGLAGGLGTRVQASV